MVCPLAGFVYRIASTRDGAPGNVSLTPSLAPTKSRQLSTFAWNEILIEEKSPSKPPIAGSFLSSPPCSSSADIGAPPEAAGSMISHGEVGGSVCLLPITPATVAMAAMRAEIAGSVASW